MNNRRLCGMVDVFEKTVQMEFAIVLKIQIPTLLARWESHQCCCSNCSLKILSPLMQSFVNPGVCSFVGPVSVILWLSKERSSC